MQSADSEVALLSAAFALSTMLTLSTVEELQQSEEWKRVLTVCNFEVKDCQSNYSVLFPISHQLCNDEFIYSKPIES